MAFRLLPGEPVATGLTRSLREAIDEARDSLFDGALERDQRIHRSRRRLKRARSLVRVMRPLFGSSYRDEVRRLRDAASLLSASRDADVAAITAETLTVGTDGRMRDMLDTLHGALQERARHAHGRETPVDEAVALLDEARAAASYLPEEFDGEALLFDALTETYGGEVRCRAGAKNSGAADRFHDWRKLVKHRWHLMRLIEGRMTYAKAKRIDRIDTLGETLGLVNDCHVLLELLAATPSLAGTQRAYVRIVPVIEARRDRLIRRVFKIARPLYRKSEKAHAKAMKLD